MKHYIHKFLLFLIKFTQPSTLVRSGLAGFVVIFLINSLTGIYSIVTISNEFRENRSALEHARTVQLESAAMISAWQSIILYGDNKPNFRQYYHRYSYHAQNVENQLFNFKIYSFGDIELADKISVLIDKHKTLNSSYTRHILSINDMSYEKWKDNVLRYKEDEYEFAGLMSKVVMDFEKKCLSRIHYVEKINLATASVSFGAFLALTIFSGRMIMRQLDKTHSHLEEMVLDRTKDYIEAIRTLQFEIEEHKNTSFKLVEAVNEADEKSNKLGASEKRYRMLVEGTRDLVFILDSDYRFVSVNSAVKNEFKVSSDEIKSLRLHDLLYEDEAVPSKNFELIEERLALFGSGESSITFSADFKSAKLMEPVQMNVTLDYSDSGAGIEIIGKAVTAHNDRISKFLVTERGEYLIKNHLLTADDVSHRITEKLAGFMDHTEAKILRVGVREMIINAIEHGNLEITYDEKSAALAADRYFEFVASRQSDREFRDKKVKIEYMISSTRAVYKISDQGKGFNHEKFGASCQADSSGEQNLHGRGIMMVKNIFDTVKFNRKGNQVLLIKYITPGIK